MIGYLREHGFSLYMGPRPRALRYVREAGSPTASDGRWDR